MAILIQNSEIENTYFTWYGSCETNSNCEPLSLANKKDVIKSVLELSDTGVGSKQWHYNAPSSLQPFSELKCGHSYFIVLHRGSLSIDIDELVISGYNDTNYGMITSSCDPTPTPVEPTPTPVEPTPTPVEPTPTPVEPTPSPSPIPVIKELEFRWKLISGREVLQVKNILKPTNSAFSSRNFESTWSTLYGFTASSTFYSLSHDTWPDAAVSSSYSHGVVNFDGLTISFGEEETKDGVTYQQLQLNSHASSTEWTPSVPVSGPAKLFVFVGDNGNPDESALLTNTAWPVITKELEPTPTPLEPTPTPLEPTPTPVPTPTPTPMDCCSGKETSVDVVNGGPVDNNNVTVKTALFQSNGTEQDGKMCWETITTSDEKLTMYYIECKDTTDGPVVATLIVSITLVYGGQEFAYTLNSTGVCYTGPMLNMDETGNAPVTWLPRNS